MLKKKMRRTIKLYLGQFISMVIMVAIGLGIFVGFNMEWYSIERNSDKFYTETGFADYRIVNEAGFSSDDLEKIQAISGVDDATRYLSINLKVKDTDKKIAMTVSENMHISSFKQVKGEKYDESSIDGIWLSDQYAKKNNINMGDELVLEYLGFEIKGYVKGLIKSSEYLVCLPDSTQLMPDYTTFGYAYVSPAFVKNVTHTEYYTQINIKSSLSKKEISKSIDETLQKTTIILSKDDVVSFAQVNGEAEEGKTMGSILPVLFLAIAVLIMVTTMQRIAKCEKTQIGILKALGFKNKKIIMHYATFSLIIGIFGTILGIGIGYLIAYYIMSPNGAMGTYMDMPYWHLYTPWFVWIVIILINLFLGFVGMLSIKNIVNKNVKEIFYEDAPKRVKPLLLEKTALWKKLSFKTKWNLRDTSRHLVRSLMSLFGVIGCTILIIGSLGMKDTMNSFVQTFYDDAIQYETKINLTEATSNNNALKLAEKYNGDLSASSLVKIVDESYSIEVYKINNDLVKFIDNDGSFITLLDDGVYICERIAEKLNLKEGDSFSFSPYAENVTYNVKVAKIIRSLSESIVMTSGYADTLDYTYKYSQIFTKETTIESSSMIVNTQSKKSIIDSFDVFMALMNLMVMLLIVAAVVLGIVVLYNLGVMSFMERYQEMATLKVVGFKDKKLAGILISQNMSVQLIGVLLGMPLGVFTLKYLLHALASEYEMIPKVNFLTYVLTLVITLLLSFFVSFVISLKNKKINMVESLKGID